MADPPVSASYSVPVFQRLPNFEADNDNDVPDSRRSAEGLQTARCTWHGSGRATGLFDCAVPYLCQPGFVLHAAHMRLQTQFQARAT